ncbi:MAG: TetR/AcrR family transcriptional regulator [Burkholderiales bacterium]|nr:TetR/AcrR family transcriptional regulator [Burkholderiales bacterium]
MTDSRPTTHQDTRERILATGEQLILGRGFSAIGLSEILSAAEVPKGSFYHYFQSKEGFGVAMLERYFDTYLARCAKLFALHEPPIQQRLLSYFDGWRQVANDSACQNMCLAVKLAAEVSDLSELMRQALNLGMQRIMDQIADALRLAQAEGALSTTVDAQELAESLYGMWVGASLLTKVQRDIRPLNLAYRQTQALLCNECAS